MKKNYLFGAALMALTWTSCTQDDSLNLVGEDNSVFTGEMEFVGSRTSLGEDNKISWVLEDDLSIFKKNNINRHYKVASIDNGKATFSYLNNVTPATVEAISGNYAVYPYSEDNSITTDGTISAPIEAGYTYTDRTSFISSALLAATSTSTNFNFKNVQGYLRLRLCAEIPEDYTAVKSVTLTSDSKYLNGTAKITWNEDIPVATIEDGVEVNNSLTVTLSEPQSLPSKESGNYVELYLPVLPMEFPAEDIELKVTFTDNTSYTKSNSNPFTITRGKVKGMKLIISDDETFTGNIEDEIVDVFDVRTNEDFAEINGEEGLANLYVDIESSTDITFTGALKTEGNVSVDMNDNTLISGTPNDYAFIASGSEADATINNTNLESKGGGVGAVDGANVTFNSGSINVNTTSTSGRYLFYLEGAGSRVTINGGNFSWDSTQNQKRAYIYAGAGTTAYVTGGTFGKASTRSGYTAGILGEGTVTITGGTFGFDPSNWVPATGYQVVKNGENWIVVADDVTVAATLDDVKTVFANGGSVILADDIKLEKITPIEPGKEVYMNLNGKTITVDENTASNTLIWVQEGAKLTIDGNGTIDLGSVSTMAIFCPYGELVIENGTFIRDKVTTVTDATTGLFMGAKKSGCNVTINGGYFDPGYYDENAADIEDILAGTKEFTETADDIDKRGNSKDANLVRVAVKDNVSVLLNHSGYGSFKVYGGTFVGANPAWGDEGCMLPTTPNYLRPWSYYQGALLDGQTFNENGLVVPDGYTIERSVNADNVPVYTVTYNK